MLRSEIAFNPIFHGKGIAWPCNSKFHKSEKIEISGVMSSEHALFQMCLDNDVFVLLIIKIVQVRK